MRKIVRFFPGAHSRLSPATAGAGIKAHKEREIRAEREENFDFRRPPTVPNTSVYFWGDGSKAFPRCVGSLGYVLPISPYTLSPLDS